MTRTDPPDILVSTVYRDVKVKSLSSRSETSHPSEKCDSPSFSTVEDKRDKNKKRHCRSFNFVESQDKPRYHSSSMEYPHRRADRVGAHPDVAWNTLGHQHGPLRFSSPDLYHHRATPQPVPVDVTGEIAMAEVKKRTRSKSASRVQSNLTPVPFDASPPVGRRGRDTQRSPRNPQWKPEVSPRRECSFAATRALMSEVHPIKLQPQRTDTSRYSPVYTPEGLDESRPDKPATSPHVRCRVDIKPDDVVLQQSGRKTPTPRVDIPWQRQSSGGGRSLTVPRHYSASRTPTPTDSFSGEYRHGYQYSQSMPNSYIQPVEISLQRMPSPREPRAYHGRERRAHSSPSVPTKFFYAEEMGRYGARSRSSGGAYYSEDHYSIPSQNIPPKIQYVQDPRGQIVQSIHAQPYFNEYPVQAYAKTYTASEPGPYIIQPPATRTFYGEDPRMYQIQTFPPRIFYTGNSYAPPLEHHIPARAYYTEGRRRARVVQPQPDDWYGSDVSGYSTSYASSYVAQVTPTRVRQEPVLTTWYANPCMEPERTAQEPRSYSRSWDNILNTHVEREQPQATQRGRSYETLLSQGKQTLSTEDRPKPVVVNLSSSPRRYAALSLSENSLIDKSPTEGGKSASAKLWYVTPEITITDNDIHPGHLKTEVRSASWDVLDSKSTPDPDATEQETMSCSVDSTKERTHKSVSLQQSLEQLDELLADLVIDYKPPVSMKPSEDLLDQLKKLIDDEEAASLSHKDSKAGSECSGPLDKQPTSIKMNYPDTGKDADGSCDGLRSAGECSPEQSPDEDDTMMCSNSKCRRTETLFNACLYFKSCHSCYTYYCSRNCRRVDWDIHKESCLYGRIGSICRHIIKHCRETAEVHKAFSRIAKVGYLSRGRGVLFLGFPNPGSSSNFLHYGLESLLMSPTYLSLRELDSFKDNLGEYCKELQEAGKEYDPNECFLLNVSIAVGEQMPDGPSPRIQTPTVRKYAKVALASYSPDRKVNRKEHDMETLILTPPPGTAEIDKEGEEGRKAREICFINIQRELRIRGVFLRHEYPQVYQQLCEFVENNQRFTPTTIYPIDKRTGKQFMCMIMAASEPRTLDWVGNPHLLDDII
ncbi:apical junction component 1 homolog [Denticeps clupeoides]|uniref:Apical junction molecule ajm1 alpha/beta domain-containing protein n=1 Tax=Denticeps clupeoides TaxID=299321 RepID=A0AAY4EBX1_9TELE|nr:apical junction component 1 homolog [Denticeps clupeoides]XP_028830399.1 apical junction component 1 homolog [Denticeps clupeoides]XP_028830400.1 apical junction component 1 homolog [Denticeps clupeoides]XP_028830402.1 apical junction component 1 homolog [Denticeps clupeoides]XP_028830403.1 apical junction component 1 homolog [Denticeps clupeoides]XP_028830404.1 apical junction component 1 homolog [Denticeps clupeoides]